MLIGAMLVRNEEGRWLEQVLEQMKSVCDKIVIVDDCSTDNTFDTCLKYADMLWPSPVSYWGTNELIQRKRLWQLAISEAKDGDWILCLDADETIPDIELLIEKIKQAEKHDVDGFGFNLYDMWSPTHYREDVWWNAHFSEWVMCVRYDPQKEYTWREQGLHCGRFPRNAYDKIGSTGLKIQHWGWSRPEDRQAKYHRYMKADPDGKFGVMEQYLSILDLNPNLKEFTT
jgi:glycosyltransferase involved in cell wall biosynthesis